MRFCITVDKATKEFVERFARITGYSESCVYSFGIMLMCNMINNSDIGEDFIFEKFFDYAEHYYKQKNKQGGTKNEKKTFSTSS